MRYPHEMDSAELSSKLYGITSDHPEGTPYLPNWCAEEIWFPVGSPDEDLMQCSRRNGHGPKGLYCKQHAKRYEE